MRPDRRHHHPPRPQDPAPLYPALRALTRLTLSNNYMLRPEALLPLLACAAGTAAAAGGAAGGPLAPAGAAASQEPPALPALRELDVSYCPLPQPVLAALLTRGTRLHALSINGCRGGVTDELWPLLHRRAEELCGGGGGGGSGTPGAAAGGASSSSGGAGAGPAPPPGSRGCAPEPAGPADEGAAVDAAAAQLAATDVASQGSAALPDAAGAPPAWPAAAPCEPAQQQGWQAHQAAHQLRSLSMVGSKELRCFCLGLAPAAAALERGLLLGGGTVAVQGGQQYALVATPLAGLRELRLSLSGAARGWGGVRAAASVCSWLQGNSPVHTCCRALPVAPGPDRTPPSSVLPQAACAAWRWACRSWPTCS